MPPVGRRWRAVEAIGFGPRVPTMTDVDREPDAPTLDTMIGRVADQYRTADEAREGILTLILRLIDEYQFGTRELDVEGLAELARAWSMVNDGLTADEAVIDWHIKKEAGRRRESP